MKPNPELRSELVELRRNLIYQKMKINRESDPTKLEELEEELLKLENSLKELKRKIGKDLSERRKENEENEENIRR